MALKEDSLCLEGHGSLFGNCFSFDAEDSFQRKKVCRPCCGLFYFPLNNVGFESIYSNAFVWLVHVLSVWFGMCLVASEGCLLSLEMATNLERTTSGRGPAGVY